MRQATLALLSLSIALAAAGCASLTPSQPGEPLSAPPTHVAPPADTPAADAANTGLDLVPAYEPAVPDPAEPGAGAGEAAAPGTAHGPGHEAMPGMDHGQPGTPTPSAQAATTEPYSFRKEVVPILQKHCASCHTAGGGGAAAVTMFDAQGEPQHEAIKNHFGRMLLEIQAGRMPQGKPNSLSQAEFDTLDQWGAADMPNN